MLDQLRSGQVESGYIRSGHIWQFHTVSQSVISITILLRVTKLVDIWLTSAFSPHLIDSRLQL